MTAFSDKNFQYTQKAHLAAREQFYPGLWPGADITFLDTTKSKADLKYAVDCVAEVSLPDAAAHGPIRFYIQERWRRPGYRTYRDLTITEWNLQSDEPSELHKLGAQLFVYGFFDDQHNTIVSALAVDVLRMQIANVRGDLKYTRGTRKDRRTGQPDQSFIAVGWNHLADIDAVMYSLNAVEASKTRETMTEYSTKEQRWGI